MRGVSRATHTSTVRWLSSPQTSLREDLLAPWVKYFQSCLRSASIEVSTIARISAGDLRTTTRANKKLISDLGLDPSSATPAEVRLKVRESQPEESEVQKAKLGLLLVLRGEVYSQGGEQIINQIINFLCTN